MQNQGFFLSANKEDKKTEYVLEDSYGDDVLKVTVEDKGKDVYKFVMQEIPPKLEELMAKTNTGSSGLT